MGVQNQDPKYLSAKYDFTRDLIQFHESRGTGLQCDPKINGKEVDLYLLYQIVTSHGGWEKINLRNEWDKLLEHFHLPRATNGGLAIKQIYLRYLELYEKIHYLGEADVDGKDEGDDEYEDFRGRRKYRSYFSSHHHHHHQQATATTLFHQKEISGSQQGLSSRLLETSDYDGLLLSLQSPLPNEQDMAISVCTLLSNETKHVLHFSKSPAILNMLLAHAGIYQDCGMRLLMEETYESREMDYTEFWNDVLHKQDMRQLLCECFVKRMCSSLGLVEDEGAILSQIQEIEDGDLSEEEKYSLGIALRLKLARIRESSKDLPPETSTEPEPEPEPEPVKTKLCCPSCACQQEPVLESKLEISIERPANSLPFTLRRTHNSSDKVGQRICQIAHILRNLSFEQDNAVVMSRSPTLIRFLLVTANCNFSTLAQTSFDIIGNISSHLHLEEPLRDPLSSMFLTLLTSGVFSTDRFKILRSLEAIRELTKVEENESIITRYVESVVYRRMCDLLTLSDIMLLIYTLECILSMTGLGEDVCDEFVRVQGSVATLVSLLTVEAQSYGPKGCILMRVVETVTGATTSTSTQQKQLPQPPIPIYDPPTITSLPPTPLPVHIPPPSPAATPPPPQPSPTPILAPPLATPSNTPNSYSNSLKIVTGTTVVPPVQPPTTTVVIQQPNNSVIPSVCPPLRGSLSEEAWAVAWLKGTFESASGTSIEQGEIYRMYSAARKNPNVVLSLEQFVQCVKCAYGVSVGPVIKQFGGGTSLSFFEGIKPNIAIRTVAVTAVATNPVSGPPIVTTHPLNSSPPILPISVPDGVAEGASDNVSVHIPQRDAKPSLSPILQATLSQPPKPAANTVPNRAKSGKKQEFKQSNKRKKDTSLPSTLSIQSSMSSKGNNAYCPASSAIRSLLASKVAQRQQNKLQQIPNNSKPVVNDDKVYNAVLKEESIVTHPNSEVVKVNGIGPDGSLDKIEESSASSSLLSSDSSDNSGVNKSSVPITSFHGVLHNGQANLDVKNELSLDGPGEIVESVKKSGQQMKGMLIDLLERRVPSREPVNGTVAGREIRISEKGLELIEKMEESLVAGSSGPALVNHSNSTCPSSDAQESQKMTFYSSTSDDQVTLQGQAQSGPVSNAGTGLSGSTLIASGGGGVPVINSTMTLRPGGQQVKFAGGKIIRLIEHAGVPVRAQTIATVATSTAIAEVQSSAVPATATVAFCRGDGLTTSFADSTPSPSNGEVTYVLNDSDQSTVGVVESVIANSVSLSMGNCSGGGGVGGGNPVLVDGEGDSSASSNSRNDNNGSNYAADSNCSNGAGAGGGDLLAKFSQFSDLIVVPPEQLASLKRPSSPLPTSGTTTVVPGNNNNNNSTEDDLPPAAKKQVLDGTLEREEEEDDTPLGMTITSVSSLSTGVTNNQHTSASPSVSTSQHVPNNNVTSTVALVTGTVTPTTTSIPPGSGAQVVQLPLRLSVNPQNPNQLTFTRQLVLPSGQQLLLSTGNAQNAIQGQVILSKSHGSGTDQMPKAIIILQQPKSGGPQVGTVVTTQNSVTAATNHQIQAIVATTAASQQNMTSVQNSTVLHMNPRPSVIPSSNLNSQVVQQYQQPSPVSPGITPTIQKVQSLALGSHQVITTPMQQTNVPQNVAGQSGHPIIQHIMSVPRQQVHANLSNCGQFEGIRASSYPHLNSDQLDMEFPYLCEWAGCGLRFLRPQQVSMHALKAHCPETMTDAVRCLWGQNGCDPLMRKRFSLMTHLQDRHCSKQALDMALYRRKNKIEPPPVPQQPLHHPGYAPNAAFHAIKRHAMSFMSAKEHLHDDNEGPVTKSIRLTAALILRNLVNFSGHGRRMLHGYESHLSSIAMSNVESSRTIAQLLHDMNEQPKAAK